MAPPKFFAFEVKRFRSLVDLKIDLSEEMPVVICGENNIGKTNFLRALNIFFNHLFFEDLYDPKIDIPYHILDGSMGAGAKTQLIGYFKDDESQFKLSATFRHDGKVEYKLKNKNATPQEIKNFLLEYHFIFIESHNINMPVLISAALEKEGLLPLDSKRAKQSKALESLDEFIRLSGVAISDIEKKINESFKKLTDFDGILKDKSIKINFAEFDKLRDAIKSMTSITLHDGNNHGIASKGSGAQRAVFISLMQYISQNSKRHVIWGVDEPEAFLQPRLQKKVFDTFKGIASDKKQPVIITTHSQHFIHLNDLDNTHLFVGETIPREYQRKPGIQFFETNTKPKNFSSSNEKANAIKEHLGISNNDSWAVMPYNLIVEGEQDKRYLETLLESLGLPKQNIIYSGSATKMVGYLQYFNSIADELDYKPKMICIFDNDGAGRAELSKIKPSKFRNVDVRVIPLIRSDGAQYQSGETKVDWEVEDFIPSQVAFELINKILNKNKYKKISAKQIAAKNKPAHINMQLLHYAEDCTKHNNPDKKPLLFDDGGRKIELCISFAEHSDLNFIKNSLNQHQIKFLKSLVNIET
jgi:predicted ATP-dependent endonuclease of OLD family